MTRSRAALTIALGAASFLSVLGSSEVAVAAESPWKTFALSLRRAKQAVDFAAQSIGIARDFLSGPSPTQSPNYPVVEALVKDAKMFAEFAKGELQKAIKIVEAYVPHSDAEAFARSILLFSLRRAEQLICDFITVDIQAISDKFAEVRGEAAKLAKDAEDQAKKPR